MSSIYEYYTNPMDIVQFLDGDKAENLLRDVLHEATMFHAETGLSPIVKSDKYDSYSLDYFFLILYDCSKLLILLIILLSTSLLILSISSG